MVQKRNLKKVKVSAQWSATRSRRSQKKKLQKNSTVVAKVAFDFSQSTGPG